MYISTLLDTRIHAGSPNHDEMALNADLRLGEVRCRIGTRAHGAHLESWTLSAATVGKRITSVFESVVTR